MKRWMSLFFLFLPATAFPQDNLDNQETEYLHMPVNISLYRDHSLGYLIGHGRPVINYVSLNIFTGRAARLRGIEIGGFANVETEYMFGLQAAGIANVVDGSAAFFQAAGIANVVDGSMGGFQAAGLANVVNESMAGFQASWIANVVNKEMGGYQLTGIANVVNGNMGGFQASGLVNVVNESMGGFQTAGLVNVVNSNMGGFQAASLVNVVNRSMGGYQSAGLVNVVNREFLGMQSAGLVNVVNGSMGGYQAAGLVNVANGSCIGAQAAGLVNFSNGSATGVQVAGLANVAPEAHFLIQAAPVNISRGGSVLPLGLISIVDDAPMYFDTWVSESGFIHTGFRSGSDWFHNLVFVGVQPGDPVRWALGWGAGLHYAMNDRLSFNLEGSVEHINENNFWTSKKNLLSKARFTGNWQIRDNITFFAGPSFNHLKSRVNDGSGIAPWEGTLKRTGNTWTRTWPGIDFGIRVTRSENGMGFFGRGF